MGVTTREKSSRNSRRPRPMRSLDSNSLHRGETAEPVVNLDANDGEKGGNPNPNLNPTCDDSGWGYCTEEQLHELLIKNLEFLYNEAMAKLISLGYDNKVALKAILRNGHCYGNMDVLSNILHNTIAYLNSSSENNDDDDDDSNRNSENSDEHKSIYSDLRQLEEYSLAGLVCLLQQVRPQLSRGDAMWCLLMSDLHVGRASTVEIPVLRPPNIGYSEIGNGNANGAAAATCNIQETWGQEAPKIITMSDVECPKRFSLSPSMKSLLKRNVAAFAAGYRANSKAVLQSQRHSQACPSSLSGNGDSAGITALGSGNSLEQYEEAGDAQGPDMVSSVLSSLGKMSLEEQADGSVDQKNEMIMNLIYQIRDLEGQVQERREWAHQKAMQAARKLSNDLTELKMLRMEKEETQRMKKGKQVLEDITMKKLSEMENALRKASGQVDRANAAVRRLENENAEIRAEMEASKLSEAESAIARMEVAKREKRGLKKLVAWEKQKAKLQDEIAEEKRKILQAQQQLLNINEARKETETKWREELKAKDQAIQQVEEERRAKEAADATVKRRLEAQRRKIEIDFQRHKDDIERLEQELSRLKSSTEAALQNSSLNTTSCERDCDVEETVKEVQELPKQQESSQNEVNRDRACLVCTKGEVSVVFLPCAHQILCVNCNEEHAKKAKGCCLSCNTLIEQRIRVYGASL